MEVKSKLYRLYKWEYFWLCLLLAVTLALHFIIIANPPELILDEQHYVNDARNIIAEHETTRLEHPPLAKLFIVAGIKLFGDNPWGWRFFSVLFGTASIVLFYFLCRRLGMSRTATSIATFLLALENMTFVLASVAMLDVYFYTFMLASFLLYVYRKYLASGVAVGLSILAKLNGALALPTMLIHWLFRREGRSRWFALTVFMAPVAFVLLMPLFDLAIVQSAAALECPISRIKEMAELSGSLTFANVTHPCLSRPWEWLIFYKPMAFYFSPHYSASISYSLWALIIPTFAYLVYKAVKGSNAGLFGTAWFAGTFLLWIPISIFTDRVSYVYYFYPTIGAVCLGLGLGLAELITIAQKRKAGKLKWTLLAIVVFILLSHLVSFIILSPVFPVYRYG